MTLELSIYRGVIRKRPENGVGESFWVVLYEGDQQINERGPFSKREQARDYLIDQMQRLKMQEGRACA